MDPLVETIAASLARAARACGSLIRIVVVVVGAGLTACGEPSVPTPTPAPPARRVLVGEPKPTLQEAEAMVREALAERAELERQADAARDAALVALQATTTTARTQALIERTLSTADIERFLAVEPELTPVRGDAAATEARLGKHDLSALEYSLVRLRIVVALDALKSNRPGYDPQVHQDAEALRPYAARLDAALKAR